jgi:hypothetical protein
MSLKLPALLAEYVRSDNAHDADAMLRCFAPDATVRDEGRQHHGAAAIREWKLSTSKKYAVTTTPTALTTTPTGYVLASKVAGNFPGSPVVLQFCFSVADGLITELAITA